MLAMDVVDTLRHEQSLVEAELDDERRQRELVARIQAIYDSQGIEVSEDVIADGVAALRENRFVYEPPERTWEVRFAEAYVDRRKWAVWFGIVALAVFAVWASYAIPMHFHERGLMRGFETTVVELGDEASELAAVAVRLHERIDNERAQSPTAAVTLMLDEAENRVLAGEVHLETFDTARQGLPTSAVYLEDHERWDRSIASYSEMAVSATAGVRRGAQPPDRRGQAARSARAARALEGAGRRADIGENDRELVAADVATVEAAIIAGDVERSEAALFALDERVDELLAARQLEATIRARFAALVAAQRGMDAEPGAAAELATIGKSVEEALSASDWQRAGQLVQRMGNLLDRLDRQYELRIVTRGNVQSGVWRHPNRDRSVRNYYIIVEAVDPDGKRLRLTVESEEDQRTRKVRSFGIRVPKPVYEQVKRDKLDNGIIDNTLFGKKRRGRLEPEYEFEVAGGRITRW